MGSHQSEMKSPMYIPEHFAEHRPEQLHRIIRENPLGILVTRGETGIVGIEIEPPRIECKRKLNQNKEPAPWNSN